MRPSRWITCSPRPSACAATPAPRSRTPRGGSSATPLASVGRVQQFHTALAHFADAWSAWQPRLPGHFLPFSAIEVPALAVPGAVVMLDLWVYVPRSAEHTSELQSH